MSIDHTPTPWTLSPSVHEDYHACVMGHDGQLVVNLGDGGNGKARQVENGYLISMAPSAPHDCTVTGCPGPAIKRKLEAYHELVEALRYVLDALDSFGREANWGASVLTGKTIVKVNLAPGIGQAALKKATGE